MVCPDCESTNTVKMGFKMTSEGKKQRKQCQKCGRTFYPEPKVDSKEPFLSDDLDFENPRDFTVRLENDQIDSVLMKTDREIESFIEELLGNWFGKVQVVD